MVAIVQGTSDSGFKNHCSGTIISKNFVLTAAHCFDNPNSADSLYLILGSDDLQEDIENQFYRVERDIERTYIHPKYQKEFHYFDLALIKIDIPLDFSAGILPICLPKQAIADVDSRQNDGVTLAGYGAISSSDQSNSQLRFTHLNIYAQVYCNDSYTTSGRIGQRIRTALPNKFQSDLLCAGYEVKSISVKFKFFQIRFFRLLVKDLAWETLEVHLSPT